MSSKHLHWLDVVDLDRRLSPFDRLHAAERAHLDHLESVLRLAVTEEQRAPISIAENRPDVVRDLLAPEALRVRPWRPASAAEWSEVGRQAAELAERSRRWLAAYALAVTAEEVVADAS